MNKSGILDTPKTLKVGDDNWEIIDNDEVVKFADILLEARVSNGILALSLGSAIVDGSSAGQVRVASRLRIDIQTAKNMVEAINSAIEYSQTSVSGRNPYQRIGNGSE